MSENKNQFGNILTKIVFLTIFFTFLSINAFAASIGVKAVDTIAGYPTLLQSQKIEANTDFTFKVEKPDGGVVTLPARSNTEGFAETELNGYHTKIAGLYKASIAKYNKEYGSPINFQVFSGVFSPVKSKILTDKTSLAAKNDTLTVRVVIKDQYDNPIKGHLVQLLSSRTDDIVKYSGSNTTNEQGTAVFFVQSKNEGVSIFTAIDLNVNQEVYERTKVVFYKPEEKFSFGGNDFFADLTGSKVAINDEALILDHFDISFPDTVGVNDDQNHLKVTAKDAKGDTVRSYTGTIKIAVTGDDNAVIPNEGEYTFTDKDQGGKEFALAMIFTTIGQVKIEVYDYENGQINPRIKGEKNVKVLEKAVSENTATTSSTDLLIKSPSSASEIASKTITVSGLASPNTNIKLMMDDIKVADIAVDTEGFFATSLQDTDDGQHEIYVMESEGLRRSSSPVKFIVDATPPRIDNIALFPEENITPESSYTVTVYSEPKLDYAKIRVAGMEEPLNESIVNPGKYEGSFIAPKNPGSYNIDVMLSDRMGNLGDYRNQVKMEVGEKKNVSITPPKDISIEADDQKLMLSWQPAQAEKKIDHYIVYVGTSQYELKATTQSKELSATLDSLQNGKDYFVALTTVDVEGTESNKSEIIPASPQKSTVVTISKVEPADSVINLAWEAEAGQKIDYFSLYFGTSEDNLKKIKNTKSTSVAVKKLENDSEYFFAVSATVKGKEGKKSETVSGTPESFHGAMSNSPLRAIPGDSKVTLSWNEFKGAARYKVAFGIQSQRYEANIATENEATSYVVPDLINGLPYYFTVYALDADGFEISAPYTEIKAVPNGYGFSITQEQHSVPKNMVNPKKVKSLDQTGPEIWAFLTISLTLAGGFFFLYRPRFAYSGHVQRNEEIQVRRIQF